MAVVHDVTAEQAHESEHQRHHCLHLLVQTPRGLWSLQEPADAPRRPVFAWNSKIGQIIADAREVFSFVENDNKYVLLRGQEQLDPERTVASYHLQDGTLLILSVQGGNAA